MCERFIAYSCVVNFKLRWLVFLINFYWKSSLHFKLSVFCSWHVFVCILIIGVSMKSKFLNSDSEGHKKILPYNFQYRIYSNQSSCRGWAVLEWNLVRNILWIFLWSAAQPLLLNRYPSFLGQNAHCNVANPDFEITPPDPTAQFL